MSKDRILSGMRPTGALHLGNYFGALENWVSLQKDYECFYFVADWHALTTGYEDTSQVKKNTWDMVIDWLSAGLDPEKCTLFIQSKVMEHAELHLLFSMITPLSWLFRCPTYKDQLSQLKDKNLTNYGFLGYPCLQAADVLMYKSKFVPVGEDQLPHLELTREIGRRFNHLYKEVFPEPQPLLTKAKLLPGIDGRKMSKSYNNTINLSDSPEVIDKKVSMMITDPKRIRKTDPGNPDICTVYAFHTVFNPREAEEIGSLCRKGEIGCVQCKRRLAEKMKETLAPIYEKRQELLKRPREMEEIIELGNKKAQVVARETMEEVRRVMGIDF